MNIVVLGLRKESKKVVCVYIWDVIKTYKKWIFEIFLNQKF